jgi:hypothetical protein
VRLENRRALEYLGQRQTDNDSKEKFRADVQKFVNEKHPNIGGFVLFDQSKRYQIEFPKGW